MELYSIFSILGFIIFVLSLLSIFKFLSRNEISDVSELEFFKEVDIKRYLIHTVNIKKIYNNLKNDLEKYKHNKIKDTKLKDNIKISIVLLNNSKDYLKKEKIYEKFKKLD